MNRLLTLLAVTALGALAGCAVVPVGPPIARVYVGAPPVAVVAPAPYVVVRPYYYRYGYYVRRW